MAWVVAACVVVVGGVLGAAGVAVAWATGLAGAWGFLALCAFGLAAVVVVVLVVVLVVEVGVDCVVEVALVAAALWLDVDEEAPQALASRASTTAARAIRRYLMADSGPPGRGGLSRRTPADAGCFPDLNSR